MAIEEAGEEVPAAKTSASASAAQAATGARRPLIEVGFWRKEKDHDIGDKKAGASGAEQGREGSGTDGGRPAPPPASQEDGRLPHPTACVDWEWARGEEGRRVLRHIRWGLVESVELGYSFCRFGQCGAEARELGCCSQTDGVFVWPEGLAHYVRTHGVRPSQAFVTHVLVGGEGVGSTASLENAQTRAGRRLMWDSLSTSASAMDSASAMACPLPRETDKYVRQHSTLGALPAAGEADQL